MNKKGFIRTLEAIIAVIIVFVFIYVISQKGVESASRASDSIKSLQEEILRGISENQNYRNCIVQEEVKGNLKQISFNTIIGCKDLDIINYVEKNLGRFKDTYVLMICETSGCGIPDLPNKNVYTTAIIITSSIPGDYKPKIVRLWVW